jgi:RNA polymerase sigma-70 factor
VDRPSSALLPTVSAAALGLIVDELFIASRAGQWGVTVETFAAAIVASVSHRFGAGTPDRKEVDTFVRSLHVEDLGLACACRLGDERAWEHFIRELRPSLYAAARTIAGEQGRDLADSLFAELFGLNEKRDSRQSLLAYYHGRARLSVWLRTVLAQRHVDALRTAARTAPLDDEAERADTSRAALAPDPNRQEYVERAQAALDAAVTRLDARDRLRLRMYYGEQLTMAQIGRMLGEHEATVSRRLDRARRQLRESVKTTLRRDYAMSPTAVQECMSQAADSPELNLSLVLDKERQGET